MRKTAVFLTTICLSLTVLCFTVLASQAKEAKASPTTGSLDLSLSLIASGFDNPVSIAHAGDDRLFVVEQDGTIRVVLSDGTVLSTPFLDITARVDSSASEEGLLGLAFHPDYTNNGYFYLNYTYTSGSRRTRISRFKVTADANIADPTSENVLLTINQPDWNHNAGDLHFGPDGYLYIPMGDGGGGGDTSNNAQNMSLLLGKIVRIDVDQGTGSNPDCVGFGTGDYTIPDDNPFIDGAGDDCDEIWAVGLRNPWRSSFDRLTGDLYIGDVGQNAWEEVNIQPAASNGGENYGWRCYEGNHAYNLSGCADISTYTFPIFEYSHSGGHCSVTGGYVYRGAIYPLMQGRYFLADYCSGRFWDLMPDGQGGWQSNQYTNLGSFGYSAFGEDVNGELYVTNLANGNLYHLQESTIIEPLVAGFSSNSPITIGQTAHFTNTTTGTPNITYTWRFGDNSPPSSETNPSHQYNAVGTYTVVMTATNPTETDVISHTFTVDYIPVSTSFTSNSPIQLGQTAIFIATATGTGPLTHTWQLGNNIPPLTGTTITHTYTLTGTYPITLTTTSPYDSDTATSQFTVFIVRYQNSSP